MIGVTAPGANLPIASIAITGLASSTPFVIPAQAGSGLSELQEHEPGCPAFARMTISGKQLN
jgi:hypothetical protein